MGFVSIRILKLFFVSFCDNLHSSLESVDYIVYRMTCFKLSIPTVYEHERYFTLWNLPPMTIVNDELYFLEQERNALCFDPFYWSISLSLRIETVHIISYP